MEEDKKDDENSSAKLKFLPTIKYYLTTYGKSMGDNDQKATRVFIMFEAQEKIRRLQQELISIKDLGVAEAACDTVIGKKRQVKYGSYSEWAKKMLLWLVEAKK